MMLSVIQDFIASNEWLVVDTELERMWKEVVVAYLKVLSRNLLAETEENHKNLYSG